MILDDNTVFFDDAAVTNSAVNSTAVRLSSLQSPGNVSPIPIICEVSTAFAGGTSLAVKVQTSADGSSWTDTHETQTMLLASLTDGARFAFRYLPKDADKPYVRLVATPTGTFTAGKLFAAIVREDAQEWTSAMKINKGAVQS